MLIQRRALRSEAAAIKTKLMKFVSLTEGLGANLHNQPPDDELSPVNLRATLQAISKALQKIEVALDRPKIAPEVVKSLAKRLADLWDGLSKIVKDTVTILAIGFLTAAGADLYAQANSNIDIPSLSRRLLDFGKEVENPNRPHPFYHQTRLLTSKLSPQKGRRADMCCQNGTRLGMFYPSHRGRGQCQPRQDGKLGRPP